MKVKDVMNSEVVGISETAGVREAALVMLDNEVHALPVIDSGRRVVGMITDGDLFVRYSGFPFSRARVPTVLDQLVSSADEVAGIFQEIDEDAIADIMNPNVVVANEDDDLWQMVLRMAREDLKYVPVVRDGVLTGILARADIIRLMADVDG